MEKEEGNEGDRGREKNVLIFFSGPTLQRGIRRKPERERELRNDPPPAG